MSKHFITFEQATDLLAANPQRQDLQLFSIGITQHVVAIYKRKKNTRFKWRITTNRFVLLYEATAQNIIYQTDSPLYAVERG